MPLYKVPNYEKPSSKSNKKVKFTLLKLSVSVLFFAAIAGFIHYKSFAATMAVSTVESETMSPPAGASVVNDASASSGKAVQLSSNGNLNGGANLIYQANSLTISAKATQCSGSPTLTVKIDGNSVLNNIAVVSTVYSPLNSTINLPAGAHSLTISGANIGNVYNGNSKSIKCSRILYVDVSTFYGNVPPPSLTFNSNPSSINSGESSVLSWSSTNATSCSAPWTTSTATSDSQSVIPTDTTTYSITCTGAGGSASASTTVSVAIPIDNKLTWAPPAMDNPTTIQIQDTGQACPNAQNPTLPFQNTNQPQVCYLGADQDYIIKINQRSGDGGLVLTGGRNVVVMGGQITPGPHPCCDRTDEWRSRGLSIQDQTGIVHVEGLLISDASDAILLRAPLATAIQIENIRVTNLHSDQDNWNLSHPDMIQTFDAAKDVRIDHFSGDTDYQGFSWFNGINGWSAKVTVKNVDFWGNLQLNTVDKWPDGTTRTKTNLHNITYMNYSTTVNSCTNCWVTTGWYNQTWQRRLYESVALMDDTGSSLTSPSFKVTGYDGQVLTSGNNGSLSGSPYDIGRRQGDYIEFPDYANLTGVRWYWGTPTTGNFVPDGVAGPNYVSPGYQ